MLADEAPDAAGTELATGATMLVDHGDAGHRRPSSQQRRSPAWRPQYAPARAIAATRLLTPMPDVILPVLDEAAARPWVLGRIQDGSRPIVVDNRPTDGSAGIAGELGALVVVESTRGFGAACWAGLAAASDPIAVRDMAAVLR